MSCTLPAAESPRPLCGRTHQNTGIWHHHQLLPSVIVQEGRRRWVLLEGCHTGGPSEKRQSLHEGQTWQLQPGVRHRSVGLRKDGEILDQTQAKKIQKVSWHHWGRWFRMDAGLMGLKTDGWTNDRQQKTCQEWHDSALFRGGNATRFRHFMAPNACGVHAHYALGGTYQQRLLSHSMAILQSCQGCELALVRNSTKTASWAHGHW